MRAAIHTVGDLLPREVFSVESTASFASPAALYACERELVEKAVAKRQEEFATGRDCARRAMRRLGLTPRPILREESGAPRWPQGVTGSISHTRGLVAAAVASSGETRGVGIDVQCTRDPFPMGTLERIFVEAELDWVRGFPESERPVQAYALFSAKESLYKCVHAATGVALGFLTQSFRLCLSRGVFSVSFHAPTPHPELSVMTGRVGRDGDHVFSSIWWPTRRPRRGR